MKKLSITLSAVGLGLTLTVSSIAAYQYKTGSNAKLLTVSENSTSSTDSRASISEIASTNKAVDKEELYSIAMEMEVPPSFEEIKEVQILAAEAPKQEESKPVQEQPKVMAAQTTTTKSTLSRGGTPPKATASKSSTEPKSTTNTAQSAGNGKVELLDWWKQANAVFPTNSVATVKDVYTGKTFKVKRTMGSNHADCEALTLEDTKIIKSIWGGFSWTRRPVHVLINGRVLAASMTAMPHAGIDSAPAFQTVDNRSGDYGRGQNLDVVKNNGMDGHFDIHFLNSTRHKDGKVDPQHQALIKEAANK